MHTLMIQTAEEGKNLVRISDLEEYGKEPN
ncbi:uncharacterized protein METZ01_LOCUS255736 [marine metagenome]|jgi:hypothetical protein|uniref:Uncharacterized protein n=1 Tax=marine metagenome TaxID=408172 RepID=A0A382IUJ2_9ZZZZ